MHPGGLEPGLKELALVVGRGDPEAFPDPV
jgi:hypothetical protein